MCRSLLNVSPKLTIGLKNIMGIIGGNRGEIHKDMGQSASPT